MAAKEIEARVSRSFDEMITIDLVEMILTIQLQTCTTLCLSNCQTNSERLLTTPEHDQPDHEGLFLQAIEEQARI